nr:hypothetical protein [Ktedonobacterales bacterium]
MPRNTDDQAPVAAGDEARQPLEKGEVAALLEEVANLLELDGGNPFEVRAYQNAARAIGMLEGDLSELVRDGGIARVPSLGKTLVARVTELVNTGHLALYDELAARVPPGLRQMLRISGLGAKRVRLLTQTLGITTLGELRAAAEGGLIATVPGFGAKRQEN